MAKHWKKVFRIIRLTILFSLLAGTLVLYRWSKSADPRFYRFVETPHGRFFARIFGWYDSPLARPQEDKDPAELTAREKTIRRILQDELIKELPTHQLLLENNKHMIGRLLEDHPDYVLFEESYGDSGSLSVRVQRSRIVGMETLEPEAPEVTYEDVRFKLEFPSMNFYKRQPYTILTDESFFQVERSVKVLQQLHDDFISHFETLITRPRKGENIQLVFFSNERSFRRYQRKYAPHMEDCLGFYSPEMDRFLVFNEEGSDQMQALAGSLDEMEAKYKDGAGTDAEQARINRWKRQSQRRLAQLAEERTFTTLRHEGSHQLFFTYGVHSTFRMENEWLIEGLAVFCESEKIGDLIPPRAKLIRESFKNGSYIPLEELVELRPPNGFASLDSDRMIELAYSESWALVHYLMSDQRRRNAFFEYIRYIRDPKHLDEAVKTPVLGMLGRFLQTSPEELVSDWKQYVNKM